MRCPRSAGSAGLVLGPLLHSHTSDHEWLSTALWAGLVLLLAGGAVAALLAGSRLLVRRAAERRRPCAGCGHFYDPAAKAACPQCGRAPEPTPDVRQRR